MTRRELREHIFKLLFFVEFHENEELPKQIALYFNELGEVSERNHTYMEAKYEHVKEKLSEIDGILDKVTEGWKTVRMSKVDLTLLRLAVYEMNFDDDIPVGVAINEAVELAKLFGGEDSSAFVNGVLAKLT